MNTKRIFKHKVTGEIATYHDGILQSAGISVELGNPPGSQFWDELHEEKKEEPKEWDILEFRTSTDAGTSWSLTKKMSNGLYLADLWTEETKPVYIPGASLDYMLNEWSIDMQDICLIHKVQRLSDGAIFTVGDKVTEESAATIMCFSLSSLCLSGMMVETDGPISGEYNTCCLSAIKHVKEETENTKETSNSSMKDRFSETLKFYLPMLPDEESRDFFLELIVRETKQEIKNHLQALYYGEDLSDPEIFAFYQHLHEDMIAELN